MAALCSLFKLEAGVGKVDLRQDQTRSMWTVEVVLSDARGNGRAQSVSASVPFNADDRHASMSAYAGAVLDGFRECVRSAFCLSQAYDDQDVR